MLGLQPNAWRYLHNGPLFKANIKAQLKDFKVVEKLTFEPNGEGEHDFLFIEKEGLNTAFVAEEMAKFAKLPLRNVSYAGRKDKFASTQQWFGVYFGKKERVDWDNFSLVGLQILKQTKNQRKLRLGTIKANAFEIRLRNISDLNETQLQQRLQDINRNGVPNYFGNQRFGERIKTDGSVELGGNLQLAEKLMQGEAIRNRNKRSMAISALRSWLFNYFVSERLQNAGFKVLSGDVFILKGSNSFFVHELIGTSSQQQAQNEQLIKRLSERDVLFSGPMWGEGKLDSTSAALEREQQISATFPDICEHLASLGLKQQRRPAFIFPENLAYEIEDNDLILRFSLPSGSFATSVLREIVDIDVGIAPPKV
ncbi:tRNA pseudouridine(13) synthase TruD [Glaciecola petra]|uniref:tRNA pseudouridine synthase D n=1 Tax=Glaciecola petra TaxID=3075602 RepID=A0ABU2ZM22_9ALTE|nr:tRNA pseudouridine(13) synthase TruD [Aestuariibacter sp. P117]MDT0593291.1 tRNA pseudouridine(13) synthase TruD [Aestuariibacter sp. P117]